MPASRQSGIGELAMWCLAPVVLVLGGLIFVMSLGAGSSRPFIHQLPIRVLLVDNEPRWDYRYVKNGLKRGPRDVTMQSWLCGAKEDYVQEHSRGLPPLRALPRTAEELARYDVILIGDVPLSALDEDAAQQSAWCKAIAEFVEKGGGVAFLSSGAALPSAYRSFAGTLLPVVVEPESKATRDKAARPKTTFRATPVVENDAGMRRIHPILRLATSDRKSLAVWRELPKLRSRLPIRRLKHGARAILVHPTEKNEHGRRVLAAVGTWGKGRTFFIATDETWLWRKLGGEYIQDRFWHNVVAHLAGRR